MWLRRLVIRLISPSYTIGAAVVLRRGDGSLLLVQQRHTGAWALPGGLVRRRELPADAAAREVAEEVGIELAAAGLGDPSIVVDPPRGAVDLVYRLDDADRVRPRRADPVEVMRWGWFDPRQLPTLTEPTVAMLRAVGAIQEPPAH